MVDHPGADEVGEFVESFNRMAEGLEETEHTRRELLTTISHELRIPLSNIRGTWRGSWTRWFPPSRKSTSWCTARPDGSPLWYLVADNERLSRVEAGMEPLESRPISADQAARSAVARIRPQFDDTGVTLEFRPGTKTGDVLADEDSLVQVLLNLMENARKYTPQPGAVAVSTEKLPGQMRFTVADTGVGVPPEDLPHIFECFHRVDKSRATASGGTGIGLAVALSLVRRMGGDITAASNPGKGTIVSFTLPAAGPGGGTRSRHVRDR